MNIPNTQRPKVSSRLRGHKATLEKSKASVVRPLPLRILLRIIRRGPRNLLLVKLCSGLVMPTKERILKLRIINALVFSPEPKGLKDPRNDYETPNG